jgi:anti-sigma factor RsiW
MRCQKAIPRLNAYVDGELPERHRRLVEAHLKSCDACRRRCDEIRSLEIMLQGSLPVAPLPGGLAARIMAESRRRQPTRATTSRFPSPAWNPLQWAAGLSVPMRLAACASVILAFLIGLSLDGWQVGGREVSAETEGNLYGIEWFDPVPPGSIGSAYLAMATGLREEGK